MLICPFCNREIPEGSDVCKSRCPLGQNCGLIRCPHCGYEMPPESRLVKLLRKWIAKT